VNVRYLPEALAEYEAAASWYDEQDARLGGCLDTRTTASRFWIELGAHTC
jgi:hypothetical protein